MFWFLKFWAGGVTGAFVGMLPATVREFRSGKRLLTLNRGVLAFFVAVTVFLLVPDFQSQELERSKVRGLAAEDIAAISIQLGRSPPRKIEASELIASFAGYAKDAELFYPSHEVSVTELQLGIHLKNGALLEYAGRVPERHLHDFSLRFRGFFGWHEIIIPRGKQWLEKVGR